MPRWGAAEIVSTAMITNAFSIDVEDYFQVSALASAVPRDSWSSHQLRVEANTHRILDMLDEVSVRGTFFVLGWVADRVPTLVRTIAARGHEVACHGYSHELIYNQSQEVFRSETVRSRSLLEDILGTAVIGYRAASFSITPKSRWALDVLLDAGFRYDSSIFPVRHDRYGMPDADRSPGKILSPLGRELVEFPMSTAQFGPLHLPVSGGGYFRILPYWLVRAGLRRINAVEKRPFTFYLHPWEVDPGQPRVKVGLRSRLRHYTNLAVCEARLARLLREFRFTTMAATLTSLGLLSAT